MRIQVAKGVLATVIGFVAWKAFNSLVEAYNLGWVSLMYVLLILIGAFAMLPGGRMALRTRYGVAFLCAVVCIAILILGGV